MMKELLIRQLNQELIAAAQMAYFAGVAGHLLSYSLLPGNSFCKATILFL